jgi:hypothetical protein
MIPEAYSEQEEVRLRSILLQQLLRYPNMQIRDLYKLFHQAALGSEHAVGNAEAARTYLVEEMKQLGDGPDEPIIDPISPSGDIVRVHLRPYIQAGGGMDILLNAFIRTANEFHGSINDLGRYWAYAVKMVEMGDSGLDSVGMEKFLSTMEREGFPAVHHSDVYVESYHPAYRVVARLFLSTVLSRMGVDS